MEAAEQPERFRRVAPTGAALSWAILLVLVVIWGSTFAGLRIAVETCGCGLRTSGNGAGHIVASDNYMQPA